MMVRQIPAGKERHTLAGKSLPLPLSTRRSAFLFAILCLLGASLLSGCKDTGTQNEENQKAISSYDIAPVFREFYDSLGGENLLGTAISPAFERDESQCQYTTNVLMCQNPSQSGSERFYLDSLGRMMNIRDVPGSFPENENQPVVDGFVIFPDFFPLYTSLYGSRFAGSALTQVHYNYEQQRVEQYFENVVIALDFEDEDQTVHLMPLGQYFCDQHCDQTAHDLPGSAIIENMQAKDLNGAAALDVATPFAAAIQQMDGFEVFGPPISHPFFSDEGLLLHIFENVVVCSPADAPEEANLCPVASVVGIVAAPAGPKMYDLQENMMFYIVEGELGFHVPLAFDSFIQQHGGRRASGNPISEVILHQDGTIRQCFENYCLDFSSDSEDDSRQVKLASLGRKYMETGLQQGWIPQNVVLEGAASENITVLASEENAQITSQDIQIVHVTVLQGDTKIPLAGMNCSMTVSLPDERQFSMDFPATDSQGKSSQVIPAMPDLQSGSMISYSVCLKDTAHPVCTSDAYLVWNRE